MSKFGAIRAKTNTRASLRQIFMKISEGLLKEIAYQIKVHRKSFPTAYYMRDLDKKGERYAVLKISARPDTP